jgi:serine/threonine protein kinase
MDTNRLCPSCQKPLAPNVPMGLCPECLIKAGFPTGVETDTGPATQPAFVPPSVEEMAGLFPQLEILEIIGRGGMGAVYKARQKQLNRFVALKILPPGIGNEPAFAERFTREARALAQLNHPNIVTLYEFGEASGQFYFLMEFVDGVNLRQLLASRRVSPREALAIVPQICDALQFAHDQGIVHRDIKPENILLDRRGRVKVADFGLAKIVSDVGQASRLSQTSEKSAPQGGQAEKIETGATPVLHELTDAGKVMGTPNYMAPEQIEHPAEVDHRADIYALGVVFYQMLTGELPGKEIEPPSSKVLIDVRLDEVVLRALEKKPELRYQQVSEVKTMVETIVAMNPCPMATPAQPQPSARTMDNGRGILQPIMKTRILIILLIIVAFALATASAALYWRHLRPWQHVVNLDSFYQVRKASASPHSQSQNSDNNLNKFPAGYRIFNDVRFNVAGLLQLANEVDVRQTNCPYPTGVEGIPVNRFCHSIYLLHGTADGTENGIVVASLILHYADGTTNNLDIIYGRQVYDWWFQASDADAFLAGNTKVAWVGENSASKIRVFQTSFANPKPEVKIESVDYVSGLSKCAPFMLALTVE